MFEKHVRTSSKCHFNLSNTWFVTTCTRSKAGGIPSYKFKWQWSLTAYIYKHHSTVKQAIWKLKWPPPWQGKVYRAHAFNLNISQHI